MKIEYEDRVVTHLRMFARAFVVESRAARFVELAQTRAGQVKWLVELDHFQRHLKRSRSRAVGRDQSVASLLSLLPAGMTEAVVFSRLRGLGGAVLPIEQAIAKTFRMGHGSILSVEPGRLALYFSEEPNANFWLR